MIDVKRLYPLREHPTQSALWRSNARFRMVPAGRRSGKTERAKRYLVKQCYAAISKPWPDPRFFAGAPTRDQAKAIYWQDLKAMVPREMLREPPRETDLCLKFMWGAELWVVGMDKPERIEGRPWDGGVLDEYGNMKPGAWGENVRPALSDRRGWCWLIGVPEGRNHYYDLWKQAISGSSDWADWAGFTWKSSDILPAEEVDAARKQLDARVFEQEYEASFVDFAGRCYYPYREATHTAQLPYDPKGQLAFCFDFNVDPGVCAVAQEMQLPHQYERDGNGIINLAKPVYGTGVIGEVWIPANSNTPAVCRKLIADFGNHAGEIVCYGDATGGARGSAKVLGSDWDLIKAELRQHFGDRLSFRVPQANPPERSRVNAVNSRLQSRDGTIRLMVDPAKAPHVALDFEGVRTLEGGSGEIDKKYDLRLTHISDALGYYVVKEFPIHNNASSVTTLRL